MSGGTRIPTGTLLVAGLVLLVVRFDGWIIACSLITSAGVIRTFDLRRGGLEFVPWPLTIIALIMPWAAAHRYLEELGNSANEVRGRERRRHVWNAVVASPGTLVTVWHGWLRAKLVKLAVRALCHRVHQVQLLIRETTPAPRQYQRLRWYCRLILCATGSGQYHVYADPARALLRSCRQSAENAGGGAELDARILNEVEKLACALTSRHPDHA